MKRPLLQFSKRRSWFFWVVVLIAVLTGGALVAKVGFFYTPELMKVVTPRLPRLNDNIPVVVEVQWDRQSPGYHTRERFAIGTPVYLIEPELTLVGFIDKIEKTPQTWRFNLQIFRSQSVVLRDDTSFELFHTSPTLLAIWGRFLNRDRREELQRQVQGLARQNRPKMAAVFTHITTELGKHLNDEQIAQRIVSDLKIRSLVLTTLQGEVLSRIDSERIFASIEQNPQVAELRRLFVDNVNWQGVISSSASRGFDFGLEAMDAIFSDDEKKTRNVFSGLLYIVTNPKKTAEKIFARSLRGAEEGAWNVTVQELRRVFGEHHREIAHHGTKLLQDTAREVELTDKLLVGVEALVRHRQLQEYVEDRYGTQAWQALTKTFNEAAHDDIVVTRVREMAGDLQNLCEQWAAKFFLNENRTGPNPLLLMAVKQSISGYSEPQIVCHAGRGLKTAENYVYKVTPVE